MIISHSDEPPTVSFSLAAGIKLTLPLRQRFGEANKNTLNQVLQKKSIYHKNWYFWLVFFLNVLLRMEITSICSFLFEE